MDNRLFYRALLWSLLVHAAVITYLSSSTFKVFQKPFKQIEVTYHALAIKKIKKHKDLVLEMKLIKEEQLPNDVKFTTKKSNVLEMLGQQIKDISKLKGKFKFERKKTPQIKTLDGKRKITIPLLKSEKITNPKYLSYNQNIRQMIKQRAYTYIDHPDFKAGEVFLTFIVQSDGTLKDIHILDDRTKANVYLRKIGIRSVKEANPFPAFPKDINYPELTFNVVISFEIKE